MFKWFPINVLNVQKSGKPYGVIILNQKISMKPSILLKLWNNASIRALVDGGANHWVNFAGAHFTSNNVELPHCVIGDLDSITTTTRKYLEALSCEFIQTPDPNETDFTKSLLTLQPEFHAKGVHDVIVIVEFGGRIDHILSQIQTLFKANDFLNGVNIYLRTKDSLAWLLSPGQHQIAIPEKYVTGKLWCSFVPVGQRNRVTTTGFKWDLTNAIVEFGGIISTSNTYMHSNVKIKCDGFLLWSMGTEIEESYSTTNEKH